MTYKKFFLSKFIDILSFEESFFFKVRFEKKIKFTDTLIALNYKKYSPYKNSLFSYLVEDTNLYIWFYEKEISSKIILPEGYLFFSFFKDKHPNTFLLIESYDNYHVLIIQNDMLVSSYSLAEKDEHLISMEMNKYALESYIEIDKQEYIKSKNEALNKIGVQELYRWSSIDFDREKVFSNIMNSVAYPLSFLLFFIMGIELYHFNQVKQKSDNVEEKYLKIKEKNDDIREKINSENRKIEQWVTFVHKELPYVDSLSIFIEISKVFSQEKFTFTSFSILGSRVKIEFKSKEDFVKGLNLLAKVKGLKSITIKHNNRSRNSVSYEARILSKGLML